MFKKSKRSRGPWVQYNRTPGTHARRRAKTDAKRIAAPSPVYQAGRLFESTTTRHLYTALGAPRAAVGGSRRLYKRGAPPVRYSGIAKTP